MYGSPGNSLIVGCLMKWPFLIPIAIIGAGGLVYQSCFGDEPVTAVTPPPAIIVPTVVPKAVEQPKALVAEQPKVVEPPKAVEPPLPLPPKKKIKG